MKVSNDLSQFITLTILLATTSITVIVVMSVSSGQI